ncbi:MAG TPA: hypothetical protein PLK94_03210 [Alphaproteobacteria bacterium]|nr:hypothetical protein [Alphaproteobacteria bacterium]HOO50279.1 hypothetical protein [Alphaproteobacteria bacterium]
MQFTRSFAVATLLVSTFLCNPAFAQDAAETFPTLSAEIGIEIQNDYVYDSDDHDEEVNNLRAKIEPYITLGITEEIALEAGLVFEQVRDPDAGDDSYFDGEGLFAEELKLTYTTDTFGLYAGKFNPQFGTAWEQGLSIYGNDFAEDYELTERIGFGGTCTVETENLGTHTFAANLFFADTSFLTDSAITSRGRTSKSDGGASNTENLNSFSVAMDSENIFQVEGLNSHFGYRNQHHGDADAGFDTEHGFALGLFYTIPVNEDLEAALKGEWVRLNNADGSDNDMEYLTTGVDFIYQTNWNLSLAYTERDTLTSASSDINDHLIFTSSLILRKYRA